MKNRFVSVKISPTLAMVSALALFGCGGGGGGGDSGSVTVAPPTTTPITTPGATLIPNTGTFAPLFRTEGPTNTPRFAISLVHPADRSTEYAIEPAALDVSSPLTLYSGTVDAANFKVNNLAAHSLVYIAGGDVKRLALTATGANPKAALQTAGVTNLCDFVFKNFRSPQGTDYGTPLASRYWATTKGADNLCATFDDGQVEISFDAQGKPRTAPLPNPGALGPVLAVLRDPVTLKPSATVHGRVISVTQPTSTELTLLPTTAPAMTQVVEVSVDALVGQQNNRLVFWDISGKNVTLDPTITAGVGWESAGVDANNFYVFRNTGALATLPTSTWKLVKISKIAPAATVLASGSGYIASASMGLNSILITSANLSGFSLNRIAKAAPSAPVMLQGPSTTQIPVALASREGVQLVLTNSSGSNGLRTSAISVVEEETNKTLFSNTNGLPFSLIDSSSLALNNNSNAAGFVIVGDISSTSGSLGATLTSYDAATRNSIVLGRMPSSGQFGFATGYVAPGSATSTFGTGSLSAITGTAILASPLRLFSFDPRVADSIVYTSSVK